MIEEHVITDRFSEDQPSSRQVNAFRFRQLRLTRIALPSIGLRTSERQLLLLTIDVALLCGALILAVKWRTAWLDAPGALLANAKWFITLVIVWWGIAHLLESYDLARAASAPHSILSTAPAVVLTVLAYSAIPTLTPALASRGLILIFMVVAGGSIALWRGIYAVLFVQPNFSQHALVLGAGEAGQALVRALNEIPDAGTLNPLRGTGYRIAGFVDDDASKQVGSPLAGVPVLGHSADLPHLARKLKVDEVILAVTNRESLSPEAWNALLTCREDGVRVTTMPTLYARLLGRIPVEHIGRNLQAVLPIEERDAIERLFWWVKRLTDVVLSAVGLLPLGVVALLVAAANALACPGPLFYRQTRVGRGGKSFTVIKFRTMRPDAEQTTGAIWSPKNDPRVTSVGRQLRRLRLDELPQLLNVLRGEMSLIGPRPERPEFVSLLAAQIPFYRVRHAVRPGITGWAQVRYGYGDSVDSARIKLEYDLYYVRHVGFYLDILILLKTVGVVLGLRGR